MNENEARRPISGWITDPNEPSGFRWLSDLSVIDDTAALPAVVRDAGDVGDVMDPTAPDPTPDEITHPDHPDFVHPWGGDS